MTEKTVLGDIGHVKLAVELFTLGARLQFVESVTSVSRERLIKLYKELKGMSPPKGLLPFSTDWHMTWQANIHSSVFYNVYKFMLEQAGEEKLPALIKSYRIYLEQCTGQDDVPVLDFTRAATMVRFFDSGMLELVPCTHCGGLFVAHAHEHRHTTYACVLCRPPSRAGKTAKPAGSKKPRAAKDASSNALSFPQSPTALH
ncbi:flagellar transcriptional regulator FlhC [Variovorax sp. LT1P1]|uniref:flagellar transcriptional regulator FlhC n=1 Tax=Variovorax sp. LT1P1 TaxID=3443730 RepID=UPI003F476317